MNIKELAKQAGIDEYEFGYMDITKAELDKFAALAVEAEREECAKLAEDMNRAVLAMLNVTSQPKALAAAIRARSAND